MKDGNNAPTKQGAKKAKASGKGQTVKLTGAERQRVNNFRLSDIAKLIEGRHGWTPTDLDWAKRYFYAALPHLIMSRIRWLDAVRDWVCEHAPILITECGADWIDGEAGKCHAKKRKCPGTDKLSALLQVTEREWHDFELVTISAASRPKAVRDAEARTHRNEAKQAKRAAVPGHTARASSKAALARASGTTADAVRSKERRQRLKADASAASVQQVVAVIEGQVSDALDAAPVVKNDRVSGPPQVTIRLGGIAQNDRVSGPTIRIEARPGFGPYNSTSAQQMSRILH